MSSKLVHIMYSGLGGHGNVVFSFIEGSKGTALEQEIIFYGIEEPREEYYRKCKQYGIPCHFIHRAEAGFIASSMAVYRLLKSISPDVVFVHTNATVLPSAIYAARRNVRMFFIEHQASHLKSMKEWVYSVIGVRFSHQVVFLSEEYRDDMKRRLGVLLSRNKVSVIPNGLNLERFSPGEKTARESVVLGMQSRINHFRDYETLLKAFRIICDDPDLDHFRLEIAGDGATLPNLIQLSVELEIAHKVIFHGMLDEDELLAFLKNLDLFVYCTFGETMSTAIMQAMAVRLPIIASDVQGVNNLLTDGRDSVLVPVKDPEKLALNIKQLMEDQGKREEIAGNAHQFATEKLSNLRMFADYMELITNTNRN